MSKTTKQLEREVREVLKIELADIAEENTLLLVAMLYGSNPLETEKTIQLYDEDSPEMKAARLCLALHSDAELRASAVRLDFFSDSVKIMLNIALANPLHGARLMPVFCAYATYAEDHDIDEALHGKMIAVMEALRSEMGFAITYISRAGVEVVPADNLCEGVEICL